MINKLKHITDPQTPEPSKQFGFEAIVIKQVAETYGKTKSPRLKQLAKFINENIKSVEAVIEDGYCNTDRKIGRLRSPGKGRYGNKLVVRDTETNAIVYEHNAAETYRENYEVCQWICKQLAL